MEKEKTLLIIRGLPGTGKTKMANIIKGLNQNEVAEISLDEFRYDENGHFDYDLSKENEVVRKYYQKLDMLLKSNYEMIISHNTNSTFMNINKEKEVATKYGYTTMVITMEPPPMDELAKRVLMKNIPLSVITRMRRMWKFTINPTPTIWYINRIKRFFVKLFRKVN